jgi:hypothetical protein
MAEEIVKSAGEAKQLITRPVLSFEERVRLAQLLRGLLDDETVTHANIFEKADGEFMRRFYPKEKYLPSPVSAVRYGHAIASACKGDIKSVLTEVMTDFCGKLVSRKVEEKFTPKPISQPKDDSAGQKDKKEIKRLIVKRVVHQSGRGPDLDRTESVKLLQLLSTHSTKGPVIEEQCEQVSLRFLRSYYPEDHRRVLKIRSRIRSRAASQASSDPLALRSAPQREGQPTPQSASAPGSI